MKFDNTFYEDEVRDGFYIPGMIKRCWAASLEVLEEVDRICKKHNITYFADWGSLLATVRHQGFIPWDDDLDIVMKRADYDRFLKVAPDEFTEGFSAYNFHNHPDYWQFITRVVGKRQMCFDDDHLSRFHQFPYMVGVDVFVLDFVSRDDAAEERRDHLIRYMIVMADKIAEGQVSDVFHEISLIENNLGKSFSAELHNIIANIKKASPEEIAFVRREMYSEAEKLFSIFSDDEADYLTQLFPFGMQNKDFRFDKKYYEKTLYLPYENTVMPVPHRYNEVLKKRYGNYLQLIKSWDAHGYPFFENQHKELLKVLDFKLPEYTFNREQYLEDIINRREHSFKKILSNCISIMEEITSDIDNSQGQSRLQYLAEAQQAAVSFGEFLENIRDGYKEEVSLLEKYCEKVFEIYSETESGNNLRAEELVLLLKKIKDNVKKILAHKVIVFLSWKPENWHIYEKTYNHYLAMDDTEVYVVPLKYYYKKYDGSFYAEALNKENYPEYVKLTGSLDLESLRPDIIFIQNPYDEWNKVISVDRKYYSEEIKHFTEKLIYIPWFTVDQFNKNQMREYHNMKDYVYVPGVINADEIWVSSEIMRENYIEKLSEFTGDKNLFEDKIRVENYDVQNEKKQKAEKTLAYHIELCSIAQYGEKAVEKVKQVLSVFEDNSKLNYIIIEEKLFDQIFKKDYKELYDKFRQAVSGYEYIVLDTSVSQDESILEMVDAYYGDGCRMSMRCQLLGKPVMIQDYDI